MLPSNVGTHGDVFVRIGRGMVGMLEFITSSLLFCISILEDLERTNSSYNSSRVANGRGGHGSFGSHLGKFENYVEIAFLSHFQNCSEDKEIRVIHMFISLHIVCQCGLPELRSTLFCSSVCNKKFTSIRNEQEKKITR